MGVGRGGGASGGGGGWGGGGGQNGPGSAEVGDGSLDTVKTVLSLSTLPYNRHRSTHLYHR